MRARLGTALGAILIVLWSLAPMYWAVNTSLLTNVAAQALPPHYLPLPPYLGNYAQLLGLKPGAGALWPEFRATLANSVIESTAATALAVAVAVMAAYAFARMRFRFREVLFYGTLATLTLPAYATLIPLYRIMSDLGLVNTYIGVILVYASGFIPLAMWILFTYFQSIPLTIEEAAAVDGASAVATLVRIALPLSLPGVTAAAIITFLFAWGQFLFPLVLTTDLSTQPLTVFVTGLVGEHVVPYTLLDAAGVLAILLPGLLVLVLNRYIVEGIVGGSVK
jgi:multiple sugar transport system permease protein